MGYLQPVGVIVLPGGQAGFPGAGLAAAGAGGCGGGEAVAVQVLRMGPCDTAARNDVGDCHIARSAGFGP
jgi:hypothetical protein